jgi:hypothetical protein
MHYLLTRLTAHARTDSLLTQARQHWRQLVAEHDPQAQPGLPRVSHEDGLPSGWAATFYMLPHTEQVLLAFAWLHWWQQSAEEEPGFIGWLIEGPGFVLNHAFFLKVLTEGHGGILGILHGFLEEIIEQAGDWNGDREAYPQVVRLLEKLDTEYRYNVHDRELWPAVLELIEPPTG